MTSVLFAVPAHLLLRRWRPPLGAFTLFFGVLTFLFVALNEFGQPSVILAGLAAGVVIDVLAGRVAPPAAVAVGVTVMWLTYFGLYQLAEGGVVWTAELWTGTVVLAGLLVGGIGLLAQPPTGAPLATARAARRSIPLGDARS
jgi:hypothetical protein